MIIHFTLNGSPQELTVNPGENVQKLLFNMGMHSVRNSDDGFGFAGSDAIIFNGNIVNASLLIAAQLDLRGSVAYKRYITGVLVADLYDDCQQAGEEAV